jgi:hypothetical protein
LAVADRNPLWVSHTPGGVITTDDARIGISSLWTPGSSAVNARKGLRPSGSTATTTPGYVAQSTVADKNVKINAFQAVIPASRATGSFIVTLDAVKTIDMLTAHPAHATLQRNDLIVAQVSDEPLDGSNGFTVCQIVGTPNASPTDPAVNTANGAPTNSPDYITLARVRVTANASTITTAMIDDLRPPWLVAAGGVLPVASAADRATLTPYEGMTIWRADRVWLETYSIGYGGWIVQGPVVCSTAADFAIAVTTPYIGQRVYLSTPRAYYRWDGAALVHERIIGGIRVTQAGIITSSNAGTEVNIPKLSMTARRVRAGTYYILHLSLFGQSSVNSDDYSIKVREDTALSGNMIADFRWIDGSEAVVNSQRSWEGVWKCTADNTNKSFFISVQRLLGTGVLDVQGDSHTSWWIEETTADSAVWTDVA